MSKIVTLTTDFGLSDPWVGIMKGVMLSIDSEIRFVEITHDIPPQNIMKAALCLRGIKDSFPKGTVHLVVVDPGVGSARDPIIIKTKRYYYVGPDNGVFTFLDSKVEKIVKISNNCFFRDNISSTFHGRDIFAPTAAKLFSRAMDDFGQPLKSRDKFRLSEPQIEADVIKGEVTYIDHFGNLFTNVPTETIQQMQKLFPTRSISIEVAGKYLVKGLSRYYQSMENGELGAIINSFDLLELFMRNKNASKSYDICLGDSVAVRFLSPT